MKKICDLVVKIKTRTHEKPYIKHIPVWGKVYKDKDKITGTVSIIGVVFFTIKDHQFCSVVNGITTHDVKTVLEDKILFRKKIFKGHPIHSRYGKYTVSKEAQITKYYRAYNVKTISIIKPFLQILSHNPRDNAPENIKRAHKLIKIRFTIPKVKTFNEIFEHEVSRLV